ncbi:MAG: hypothetical protein ACREIS_14810 [Nitrospiraceae bacterium]
MASHIKFVLAGESATGKTLVWNVVTKDDVPFPLGQIRWFGRWHQYAFFPNGNAVFEKTCLRDIAAFCADETGAQRRESARTRKANT